LHPFSVTTRIIQIIIRLAVHDKRVLKSTGLRKAFKNVSFMLYKVRKSSISRLFEAIGETKTKIYCQANVPCRTCVLAEPITTKVGRTKAGNQANGLKYSEKNVTVLTNLHHIFKRLMFSKPKSTQQKLTCALKNIRFVPGGCAVSSKWSDDE
jgi:hypothetical protein